MLIGNLCQQKGIQIVIAINKFAAMVGQKADSAASAPAGAVAVNPNANANSKGRVVSVQQPQVVRTTSSTTNTTVIKKVG